MSLEVAPYAERRRQPTVAVVAGTPERLRYITSDGVYREGDPETLWAELAVKESYPVTVMDRGKERQRTRMGSPPIVIAAKRGSIRDLVRTCDARHWTGLRSTHGKYKTLVHDGPGPSVRRLGITADLEPAADGLFTFIDFLNAHGVRFGGSIAGAGLSLFRTTLDQPLRLWAPPNALDALWPGRREYWHEPRRWHGMTYYDLKAAYPAALQEYGIPTHWHQVDPTKWRNYPEGFSVARALTPNGNLPNPLPMRLRPGTRRESISWASGAFAGTYPNRDLSNADSIDCWIEADETWAPTKYTDAFSSDRWQALRVELRSLPGIAGALGKLADNGLWGMFAFDNSADVQVRWRTRDGNMAKSDEKKVGGIRKAHGVGVALAATARVRQTLWKGVHQSKAIYCDTDGLIAPTGANLTPYAGGEGTWHSKGELWALDIKAPQLYRWLNPGDTDWHYLGESQPHSFNSAAVSRGQLHGDDMGTAAPMSVRKAHLLNLMQEDEPE